MSSLIVIILYSVNSLFVSVHGAVARELAPWLETKKLLTE